MAVQGDCFGLNRTTSFGGDDAGFRVGSCMFGMYLLPSVCGLGLVLNVMSAAGFTRAHRRGLSKSFPLLHFLVALSCFDAVQLGLTLMIMGLEQWSSGWLKTLNVHITYWGYPLMMAANYASIWSICVISLQRFIAICYPLRNLERRPEDYNTRVILAVCVVALALNACRLWEHKLMYSVDAHGSINAVHLSKGPLFDNHPYQRFMCALYIALVWVGPVLLLTLVNVPMLRVIRASQRLNERISSSQKKERKVFLSAS